MAEAASRFAGSPWPFEAAVLARAAVLLACLVAYLRDGFARARAEGPAGG